MPGSDAAARLAVVESWLTRALPAEDVLAIGELWQSAGDGPDKASGQWFTPAALVRRLLDQWANDWLADQHPGLTWTGGRLVGPLRPDEARHLLQTWTALSVIDPAMGAGDWLCGWFQLHRTLGAALAGHCDEPAPAVLDTLRGLHGIDQDTRAVALAMTRLALLAGQTLETGRLCSGDSLMDETWPTGAFDVILGNPPYVSSRRRGEAADRQDLLKRFGYADDLYAHFIDQGLQALKPGGWLLFIVSDTFRTTVTKARLRRQLLAYRLHRLEALPDDAFPATVATVALTVRHLPPHAVLDVPPHGPLPLAELLLGPRHVMVDPSPVSRERLQRLRPHWEPLLTEWAEVLQNVRRQQEAAAAIDRHRRSLKPGDWTLLGLLCDGGVGLQTGDNGARLAIRADCEAGRAATRRQAERLADWQRDAELAPHLPAGTDFETGLTVLRQRFPLARLGLRRGEVWRTLPPDAVADPTTWPEAWRRDGAEAGPVWVPYEKGDPQGRRWVHENPFLIRWDRDAVADIRQSGRGKGEPILRNPQFFFRSGVTWSNMSSHSLKARLQPPCVFDVGSMTLFPAVAWLDSWLLLAWLNAAPTTAILKAYVNHTLNFQINDLRLLPVPVPEPQVASRLQDWAKQAVSRGPGSDTADLESRISTAVAACYGAGWHANAPAWGFS